ncbi:MAG: carboxypeptidase regulatory-like domain-containing protein [Phycisphaerae bacterium]|nr:carboxypeptidase regulatory-like domain-containing protein [Phycisphaerae bacterium]
MTDGMKTAFLCMAFSFAMIADCAQGQAARLSGRVLDVSGEPISGAKVRLYEIPEARFIHTCSVRVLDETTTKADGVFFFECTENEPSSEYVAVASKEGLALSWAIWRVREHAECGIVLTEPKRLGGVVVDLDDKPVAGATVFVTGGLLREGGGGSHYILRPLSRQLLTTKTGENGRFAIDGLAADATFELGAAKEGYATMSTFDRGQRSPTFQYTPGREDIKLVTAIEARIKGRVVEEGGKKPVAGVTVTATDTKSTGYFQPAETAITKDDGTFVIGALGPDTYTIALAASKKEPADWVAAPVTVNLSGGQTSEEVDLSVGKGALLEFRVVEENTGKPIAQARMSVRSERTGEWSNVVSDAAGLAVMRVLPGSHIISGPYAQDYASGRRQETVAVLEGAVRRIELTLKPLPKISGTVRDPEDNVVEGAQMRIMPGGGRNADSDSQGRFEIAWDQSFWGERETVYCLVARHAERNLAAAVEIGEGTRTLDVRLAPGVVMSGRVVDREGKGIRAAKLVLMLQVSNWGSSLERQEITTGKDGSFAIKALPARHKYSVRASAQGYGSNEMKVGEDRTVGGRVDIGDLTLSIADLAVSGRVADAEDKPVAGARIESSGWGKGQPDRRWTYSDADGGFSLDGVCEGEINLTVDAERMGSRLSARVLTHGGASGIKIIAREGNPVLQYISGTTYAQTMATAEKLIAGVAVDEAGAPVAGVPVGVCCIKREREPGKYSWTYSSFTNLRDITDEQGRFAIELEEGVQFNLRFSPDNHAALIVYDIPAGTKDLKVTLPEGGTVNGRLVRMERGDKVPIPNAEVKIEQVDRTSYTHLGFDRDRTTVTDSQGRFLFKHIRRKIRPMSSRSSEQWEYVSRVWKISYGSTAKNVVFYDNTAIDDFELLVEPDPSPMQLRAGAPLPSFDGIKIDFAADRTKDKAILVCFFDMQQRPSRNCILQLAGRAEMLKEKGVVVACVQTSMIEENELAEWVKEQGVSFPVGIVTGDEKAAQQAWGVQSLPWLILTDKNHMVKAQGFGLSDLEENLTSAAKSD